MVDSGIPRPSPAFWLESANQALLRDLLLQSALTQTVGHSLGLLDLIPSGFLVRYPLLMHARMDEKLILMLSRHGLIHFYEHCHRLQVGGIYG